MLRLADATIGYRRDDLLVRAGLALEGGSVTGLVAPNGYGKTTLLRVLSGDLRRLREGSLAADGISPLRQREYARAVYYAPSDDSLLHLAMSARFHLEAVKGLWGSPLDVGSVARELMMGSFVDKPARRLSQGMRRQLSLAMARMSHARHVLLDEPMNALDPIRSERAARTIRGMADEGASVLIASHMPEELDRICDGFLIFRDRRVERVGTQVPCRQLFHACYEDREREVAGIGPTVRRGPRR